MHVCTRKRSALSAATVKHTQEDEFGGGLVQPGLTLRQQDWFFWEEDEFGRRPNLSAGGRSPWQEDVRPGRRAPRRLGSAERSSRPNQVLAEHEQKWPESSRSIGRDDGAWRTDRWSVAMERDDGAWQRLVIISNCGQFLEVFDGGGKAGGFMAQGRRRAAGWYFLGGRRSHGGGRHCRRQ